MSNTLCYASLWESADREWSAHGILAGLLVCECTFGVVEQEAGLGWLQAGSVCPVEGGWWLAGAVSGGCCYTGMCSLVWKVQEVPSFWSRAHNGKMLSTWNL